MERISDAISWYNEMIRCNVAPSIVTYAAIIDMFSKAHSYDQALNWVNEMINNGIAPNVYAPLTIIYIFFFINRIGISFQSLSICMASFRSQRKLFIGIVSFFQFC